MQKILIATLISFLTFITGGNAACNLPDNSTFEVTITPSGGDFECGETVSISVDTEGNSCDLQWSIVNDGGTVIEQAEISDDTAESTDVILYWFNDSEADSCTWKLKCKGTTSINSCEDEVDLTVTLPDGAGQVLLECDWNFEDAEGYGKFWITSASASAYPIEYTINLLETSVFYDKVEAHETKHLNDANDASYMSGFVSDSRYWMRCVDNGSTSPATSVATSYTALFIQAEATAYVMMSDLAADMEDRAYAVSDAIAPQLFYQSTSGRDI